MLFQSATELDAVIVDIYFLLFQFFQLTDTDARIDKGDENLHALVKELNGNMSAKARFTACNHLIEALFYFP